jgi:TonB family protein
VRARRPAGVVMRPLNFTVRRQMRKHFVFASSMIAAWAVAFWLCCALLSCATPKETSPSVLSGTHVAPPPEIATQTPRKLPKWHLDLRGPDPANDPYPEQAKRQGLAGRVLVEFQIDRSGKAVSAKILAADAASVLQAGALKLIRSATFDTSQPGFDPADSTPFLVTVRFCLPSCGPIVPFAGTEEVDVRGSPLR